ncbi:MAG: heme biosynthesis protein HemY [Pirellulaceae bacterium]|nr:MAG: heme biosynthesis protein HemY [Pirellulaceae bacterium]
MPITLTERAAQEVKRVLQEQQIEEPVFLRVGISAGGCSGFSYLLQFDRNCDPEKDTQFEQHGVKVVVDKKSALYLEGTTVDWYESLERRGFTFNNPNAVRTCGCGSSFQV